MRGQVLSAQGLGRRDSAGSYKFPSRNIFEDICHFCDHLGEPRVIEASGWYARILQHETDHLHGTLYIDRMLPRSFSSLENYTRHWKDLPLDVAARRSR